MFKIPFTKNNKDIQIFNTLLSKGPVTKQMKMPAIMFNNPLIIYIMNSLNINYPKININVKSRMML